MKLTLTIAILEIVFNEKWTPSASKDSILFLITWLGNLQNENPWKYFSKYCSSSSAAKLCIFKMVQFQLGCCLIVENLVWVIYPPWSDLVTEAEHVWAEWWSNEMIQKRMIRDAWSMKWQTYASLTHIMVIALPT